MDNNTTTIIIIGMFALIVVAVVLIYRSRAKIEIKGPLGTGLKIDASNSTTKPAQPPQSGVVVKDAVSTGGGLLAEDGTGRGAQVERVQTHDDIIVSSAPPPDPKAKPPA